MNQNFLLLNFLGVLVLSQTFTYFSLYHIHFLLLLSIFCFIGVLIAIYFSVKSNHSIRQTNSEFYTKKTLIKDYFLSYKFYSDLVTFLSTNDKNFRRSDPNRASTTSSAYFNIKELTCEHKRRVHLSSSLYELQINSFDSNLLANNNRLSFSSEDFYEELSEISKINNSLENEDILLTYNIDGTEADQNIDEKISDSKLESELNEIIELIVRDFLLRWLDSLIWENDKFFSMTKTELTQLIESFRKRVRNLDYVKFLSRDFILTLNEHYFNAKKYNKHSETFKLNNFEISVEKEAEYLRNLIEIFILNTFNDKAYIKNGAIRSFLREILLNKVLLPTIDMISDPDYLNRKLINHLTSRESQRNSLNNLFTEASTYEDLIKIIKSCKSVDELKQIYYKIMNEIMESTIISNFKDLKLAESNNGTESQPPTMPTNSHMSSAIINGGASSFYAFFSDIKSIDDNEAGSGTVIINTSVTSSKSQNKLDKLSKTELLRSGDLKPYIKKLRSAKLLCENRLRNQNLNNENQLNLENKLRKLKVLPFEAAIHLEKVQVSFVKYLENDGSDALLRFWIDLEKFKKMKQLNNIKKKYELANKIHENYLKSFDSPVRDEIGKELYKSMQLFLMGNNTDECFFIAQEKIRTVLESDHYPSFLASELYQNLELDSEYETYLKGMLNTNQSIPSSPKLDTQSSISSDAAKIDQNKKQIDILKEKLNMKLSALNAIKSNSAQQEDSKRIEVLDNDIKQLRHKISIFQSHIQKTELWCDNIGKFTTNVVSVRLAHPNVKNPVDSSIKANHETVLLFEIQVQLHESFDVIDPENLNENKGVIKEGWIIYRTIKEFDILNENLSELLPIELKLKFKKIPRLLRRNLVSIKAINEERQEKARMLLDEYLRAISEDESLAQSEALYTFLCPSPDYFKKSNGDSSSEEKFSMITSLFRSSKSKEINEDDYLDDLFSDSNLKTLLDTNARDSIAEPFYHFIEEIFGLKSKRRWFRKSLIIFVQLTYGATINRKIRESIYWMLSNDMLTFYFKQIKDSFWRRNEATDRVELIASEVEIRMEHDKLLTKKIACEKLISNVPETLQRLVGEKNAQNGVIKMFEMFQDKKLNKHLIYSTLDILMNELFLDEKVFK